MQPYQTLLRRAHWSFVMRSGSALTLTDVEGGASASLLFYNPENLLERYNAPDTLKCQHTFRLTAGHCLYSDMGRIFCGIEHDSFGWHESVCGTLNAAQTAARYGVSDYQQARNLRHQNGYDSFPVELAKYGLGQRDMAACLNLFAQVRADDNGRLTLERQGRRRAGSAAFRHGHAGAAAHLSAPAQPGERLSAPAAAADAGCAARRCRKSVCSARKTSAACAITPLSTAGRSVMIKESERNPAQARLQQQIDAGDYWLQRIAAGETLRITDLEGNQAADTLFFNADDTAERYSMSETLRGQHNVFSRPAACCVLILIGRC